MACGLLQWLSAKFFATLQPKGSTPLPGGIVAALFFSMFGNAIAMQMLFAFLPDMVKSFGIADEDAGYYVGMIASSIFLGRFLSSYFWGWFSDKIGRRKVLLWCTASLAVLILAFGFSKSFETALVIRFITGLIAGIPGTVKASLSESCDDSNQALGMSVVITAWNTGLIVGPAVGGYLAKPTAKYSIFKDSSFFENFAYLLPCIVNAAINLLSFVMVFFLLPETLPSKRKTKDKGLQGVQVITPVYETSKSRKTSRTSTSSTGQCSSSKTSSAEDELRALDDDESKQPGNEYSENKFQNDTEMLLLSGSVSFLPELHFQSYPGLVETCDTQREEPYVPTAGKSKPGMLRKSLKSVKRSKLAQLCRNKDVRNCVAVYTVFSFAVIAEHEMYSLWAATGNELGGLQFDTNDLGFTLMIVGIGCSISNCIVFPQMVNLFGLLKTIFILLITGMFFVVVFPATSILYGRGVILKVMVIVVVMIIRVAQGCCFTGLFIMIGNTVSSHFRGTVHGLSTSAVCFARTISPTIAGSLFSWSITSGLGFPFNEKLVFIFIGLVLWFALILACCLDEEAVTKQSKA